MYSLCSHHSRLFLYTGPGLALKGALFPNHGVLLRNPSVIGEDEDALYCVTDNITCCGKPPNATDGGNGNGLGHWYFPNGNELQSGTAVPFLWYARWLTVAVLMNFRGSADTGTTGLYRCDIQDNIGTLHQFYTCIYNDTVVSDCKSVAICMCSTSIHLVMMHAAVTYTFHALVMMHAAVMLTNAHNSLWNGLKCSCTIISFIMQLKR